MKIRWFPPSWLQISTNGKIVYVDPAWIQSNFSKHPNKVVYSRWPKPMDGLPEAGMPEADVILYTHHHQDHIKTATLKRLANKSTTVIVPRRCSKLIGRNFISVSSGEEHKISGISIQAVQAYNTPEGSSTKKRHKKDECVGYVIRAENRSIYHAGDTDFIREMSKLGDIDIAFLPIGGTFTMDIDEAVKAVGAIRPKMVAPMHYLKANPGLFTQSVSELKVAKAILPSVGEEIELQA